MTRQATTKALWANVPGVTYPVRAVWESIPGVVYPDKKVSPVRTTAQRERRHKRREKTISERRQKVAENAAKKAERIARLIALYDDGKTVAQAAEEIRMCPLRASSHLRKAGRKVFKGRSPKLGRGQPTLRDSIKTARAARAERISAVIARVVAAYHAMPAKVRSANKVAAASGICSKWACKLLKRQGLPLSSRGRKAGDRYHAAKAA